MRTSKEIEETCKKLKPIIGKKADKLWYIYLAEDKKGRQDIALDIEIIAEKYLKKDALEKQQILLEPPHPDDSYGSFLVGDVVYNRKKLHSLHLRHEDFIKQVGIFSITGEGKTNLAYLQALQLLKHKVPFLVIDWKRSWRNLLSLQDTFPELKDVRVFTIGRDVLPFLWNPFRQPPGADNQLWISTVAEALERSHLSGPGVAYHLERIYLNLIKGLGRDFYPNFFDGLKAIKDIKVSYRELQWKQTALRIFQSFTIGNTSKTFNARNPIKLEELLDKPVILELDLEMPKPLRIFFSEIILRWIHLYRLGQGESEKLRHVLFLEEVHNLFTENRWFKYTNSLENVYREVRAFGQGIMSITQHPSMLPIYLLGNCHTQIYLGLQHEDDIRTARKSLFLRPDEESYPNLLNVGECITKIKNRVDPCLVKIPLVPVKKGLVTDDWLKVNHLGGLFWKYAWKEGINDPNYLSLKSKINNILSSQNKGGYSEPQKPQNKYFPNSKKPKFVSKKHQNTTVNINKNASKYPLNSKASQLLEDIFLNPFSSTTKRYRRLGFSGYYGNKLKNILISQRCILPRKVITNKYRLTLFDLTKKGKMILRDLGHRVTDRKEGIVHRFWKDKISEHYRRQGLKVLVEESINGRPDIIVIDGKKKIAIEIETGKSDAIGNIQRALKAGFDEVICVATSRMVEERIGRELEEKGVSDERVKFNSVLRFRGGLTQQVQSHRFNLDETI